MIDNRRGSVMKIICAKDYEHASKIAANMIAAQVIMKPDSVLGLATGSTPLGAYEQLIEWHQKGYLDFSKIRTINLDEYRGLCPENEQSYHFYMKEHFLGHINITNEQTYIPDGTEPDADKACADYDAIIDTCGGIDLQILGLGHNGHIGFNEPEAFFSKGTHCVKLAESTIRANARFFASINDVPKEAYTMGIKSIMQAKKIMIMVSGEAKKDIVRQAFFGTITPQVPASVLQLHRDVVLVGDEAALAECPIERDKEL